MLAHKTRSGIAHTLEVKALHKVRATVWCVGK